jgi:NAD kinase
LFTAKLQFWDEDQFQDNGQIDFVVTLGGDGTVLYASWLFQRKAPPIIPFNLGSLGFLTVFELSRLESTIEDILNCENVSIV